MDNNGAIGFIELPHLCDATAALDVMLKTASATFLSWEKKLGGRLITVMVGGSAASVTAAVDAAKDWGGDKIKASLVLANPHTETWKMVRLSAAKYGGTFYGKNS